MTAYTMPPRRDEDPTDYEQLRKHLARPRVEHPAVRPQPAASSAPRIEPPISVSVMEWLLAVSHAVARRLRRAPSSALVRLHPPE